MSALLKEDWKNLRSTYKVAFTAMSDKEFQTLIDKVFANEPNVRGPVNEIDTMMITLARAEPGILPEASIK